MDNVKQIEIEAERIVAEELADAKQRIIANHIAAGQQVTRATSDSLYEQIENTEGGIIGTIYGRPYFAALETGTKPWAAQYFRRRKDGTTYPVAPKFFVDIIAEWMAAKQIADKSPWGIATRIMVDGSTLFREGGRDDIFSNEIPVLVKRIGDRLAGLYEAQIVESILRQTP